MTRTQNTNENCFEIWTRRSYQTIRQLAIGECFNQYFLRMAELTLKPEPRPNMKTFSPFLS